MNAGTPPPHQLRNQSLKAATDDRVPLELTHLVDTWFRRACRGGSGVGLSGGVMVEGLLMTLTVAEDLDVVE